MAAGLGAGLAADLGEGAGFLGAGDFGAGFLETGEEVFGEETGFFFDVIGTTSLNKTHWICRALYQS